MDTIECIHTRRSIRKYTSQEVSDDLINQLLEAAMNAPSANNEQPWHFIVIKDKDILSRISQFHQYIRMAKDSPVGILVCSDNKLNASQADFWVQDCAAATQNILLAAHALGLGAVWTGIYPKPELMRKFSDELTLPANIVPFAFIPFGHPAQKTGRVDRYKKERVHNDKW
jgi:nitroreductase